MKRKCDGCTKCCEGWLSGVAKGHNFYRGKPCHFKSEKGCSIYKDRPTHPCKNFVCEWLTNSNIPEWMKPDKINAIIVKRLKNNIEYFEIAESGEKLKVEVLSWFVIYCLQNKLNLHYKIDNGSNRIGSIEFLKLFDENDNEFK